MSIFFAQVVCCGHAQKALCLETQLWGIQNGLRQHFSDGYGSIPIDTVFSGMNIHLPAILMFTRGIGF